MKKILLILILSFSLEAFTQEFNGGLLAGFTASQVDGDGYGGFDKTGFIAGVFVNRIFSYKYTGQMEIVFSQRGSKKNINPDKNDYEYYRMHLLYIEVPLILKYSYSEVFSFSGGVSPGVLVNSTEEDEYSYIRSNPFYKYSFSSIIGVEYKLSEKIILSLRETYSLYPIRGYAENGRWWYSSGQFSNSLSFTVNYQF